MVVGGGVSGCACAATLASAGVQVTVVSSALDSVGLPAYGPDVLGGSDGWEDMLSTLAALPPALRDVWLDAGMVVRPSDEDVRFAGIEGPHTGASCGLENLPAWLNVDRRMVSVETKRALEKIPGLEFRQGLVRDVRLREPAGGGSGVGPGDSRPRPPKWVAVETVFGEVLESEVLVIAVGLSMGGQVAVGDDRLPGGRYGEMPSGGMREALERFGVEFDEVTLEVGPRFSRDDESVRSLLSLPSVARSPLTPRPDHDPGGIAAATAAAAGPNAAGTNVWAAELAPARTLLGGLLSGADEGAAADRAFLEAAGQSVVAARGSTMNGAATLRLGEPRVAGEAGEAGEAGTWPEDFPPAPHWERRLRMDRAVASPIGRGRWALCISPDGMATHEVYWGSAPEGGERPCGESLGGAQRARSVATRLQHSVQGLAVKTLGDDGRLMAQGLAIGPVWVSGRAGGATGYLESLASGVCVARSVLDYLRCGENTGSESSAAGLAGCA